MNPGLVVLLVVVPFVIGFGLWRAWTDGRFRGTHVLRAGEPDVERVRDEGTEMNVIDGAELGVELGEKATLLQFSTAFCAPCRATRRVLDDIAAVVPGVVHVELDAELHLELVRELGILRTPTTLILGPGGREITRASGAPRKEQVLGALAALV